jgi:hypothetical protein
MKAKALSEQLDDVELWNREDASELERPTQPNKYGITVASRDWTVETIVRQVEQENIDLDPAFQRRNAWRDHRRSRLIESFILGFPVPQLVLAENPRRRGTFIVIDGKQRLLTIAGLFLPAYRNYWANPRFSGLSVLTDFNGVDLDKFLVEPQYSKDRRQLTNADIRTTIITGFKDEDVLYDIFYRINTGSVPLSSQELRQVLNRGEFAKYLLQTTSDPNPLWEVLNIDAPDPRLRDVELLLRLIAWRRFSKDYKGNMKAFLDEAMVFLNKHWGTERSGIEDLTQQLFHATATALKLFGKEVGRKFKNGRYERSLNRALFEVQAYYFSFPKVRTAATKSRAEVLQTSKELFSDTAFTSSIESTTKSVENYRTRFSKYQKMLQDTLGIKLPSLEIAIQSK